MITLHEIKVNELRKIIMEARTHYGISQKKLGELIGIPQANISKFESGKTDMTLTTLYKITNPLNIDLTPKWRESK